MRRGNISPAAKKMLMALSRPLTQEDGLFPTELFPLRADVERANGSRLAALSEPIHKFEAKDSGSAAPEKRKRLLDNMVAVKTLELKCGAQVMLVKNVNETLVNGSVGRVLGFYPSPEGKTRDDELLPLVEFRTRRGKETVLVYRDEFRAEDADGKLLARRWQVGRADSRRPTLVSLTPALV
ncbi:hypothetical protein F4779DRAFT_600185 [Xylariaceae sp. FL0662B]|nr:hypothetical protein F4779DRAFT_600185 [Xylariaceae sp. FL0662B]